MKWLKKTLFMALLLVTVSGTVHTQAAYNKALTDRYKTQTVQADLNKDGKKERIKAEYRGAYGLYRRLYINNKLVIKSVGNVWILDIDSRDHYIEIAVFDDIHKLNLYRYNGKKLVLYASAKTADTISGAMKKNRIRSFYEANIKTAGNGTIIICSPIGMNSATDYWDTKGICDVYFRYTVKKNAIKYDQSSTAKAKLANDAGTLKIKRKWEAYKYPRLKSNKKAFMLKKGENIKVTDFKFTPAYTYMKVKRVKTKQTGWIIFRTKDLDK